MQPVFGQFKTGGVPEGHFFEPFHAVERKALQGVPIITGGAGFDLHKMGMLPFLGHNIDLPPAGAKIAFFDLETPVFKIIYGEIFPGHADRSVSIDFWTPSAKHPRTLGKIKWQNNVKFVARNRLQGTRSPIQTSRPKPVISPICKRSKRWSPVKPSASRFAPAVSAPALFRRRPNSKNPPTTLFLKGS